MIVVVVGVVYTVVVTIMVVTMVTASGTVRRSPELCTVLTW